jgi:general secretion pathway protein I
MDTRSRFDTVATMLARQKLADIAIADLSDMTIDSGDFGDDHPGYTWRIQSDIVSSDQFREDGPVLKRLQVTISRDGDASEFNLSTYRYLYE